jgi:aryl-alcohol dehydrogenase-like predicted oxidoreductase
MMTSEAITAASAGTLTPRRGPIRRAGGLRAEPVRHRRAAPGRDGILAVARAHGATAAQVRLAWTLQRGPHVLAIPGTGNPDHLVANVAAGALRLSEDELARLEALHR